MKPDFKNRFYEFKERAVIVLLNAEKILNRTVLIAAFLGIIIWWNFGSIVELLVDENRIRKSVMQKLDESTGRKSEIAGSIKFQSNPEPVALINKIIIHNNSELTQESFLEAESIKIKPKIYSVILGKPKFDSIEFDNVTLNMDSGGEKGEIYDTIKKSFSGKGQFGKKKILFLNLKINTYKKNPLPGGKPIVRSLYFPQLELNPLPLDKNIKYQIAGSINSHKFRETYYFDIDFKNHFGKQSDYSGKIYSNDSEIKFSGSMDTTEKFSISGKLSGKINGFARRVFSLCGIPESVLDIMKDGDESIITGDFSYDGDKFILNKFNSEGNTISFLINSNTELAERSQTAIDINITKLDYSKMFKSQQEILSNKKAKKIEDDFKKRLEEYFLFSVGDDVNFTFNVNAPKINFYNEREGSLSIQASLKDNQFKLDQVKAILPGQTEINFVGYADIDKQQRQLKGATRIVFAGKNMDELFMAFDPALIEGQSSRFGPFYIDAKGFLYGQNIHFRDIVSRINDDRFAGQMLIDYSQQFNSSAAFNFTSLNVDKYLQSDKRSDLGIFNDDNPLSAKFDFLRVIDSLFDKMDVSITTDKLTKAGYDYRDVLIYAHITPGITDIKDIYFDSDLLGRLKGHALIDLTDFQPKIDVDLVMDKYDLDLLIYGEPVKQNDAYKFDGKWSNEKVTFERLGTFHGKINLSIKELRLYHFFMKNFIITARAEEGRLNIDEMRTDLFGNKIDFKGYLTTEYPSFNLTFMGVDIDSDLFLADTFNLNQLSSTFNTSGVLASYGFSIEQMIQNLKGNFSVATKGFSVHGFDFEAVVRAVDIAKRREYIKIITNELLNKGDTKFSYFMGAFDIDSGIITFRDLGVTGPFIDKGLISGVIDLPKWQLNVNSNFHLKTGTDKTMNIKASTSGLMPKIDTNWDDQGVAEYWENRFYTNQN